MRFLLNLFFRLHLAVGVAHAARTKTPDRVPVLARDRRRKPRR